MKRELLFSYEVHHASVVPILELRIHIQNRVISCGVVIISSDHKLLRSGPSSIEGLF